MAEGDGARPINLFYSYSHKDEDLRLRLQDHLAVLRWSGLIDEWHDRDIDAGEEWAKEIDRNLDSADVILLLVSASFIASKYCWSIEMTKALERHNRGEATVIPVILKPCRWMSAPFAKLQAAPTDAKAVTSWADPEAAFDDIAGKIERVVTELRAEHARLAAAPVASLADTPALALTAPLTTQTRLTVTRWEPLGTGAIEDFDVFRDTDAPWCPEMVALPGGTFLMGSPDDQKSRRGQEGPQHPVTIGTRFAIGRYAVTFDEYDCFCTSTGREAPRDERGWGRARRPVINVSWPDAVAYCRWLTQHTHRSYRLPSEAEWEYACRAGTTTPYAFGDVPAEMDANLARAVNKTTEVGVYPANPWGLYDMYGNVWEWVEDIWHDSYEGAPADGLAWTEGEPETSTRHRVSRGGSWNYNPRILDAAFRSGYDPLVRNENQGFRVARTLD